MRYLIMHNHKIVINSFPHTRLSRQSFLNERGKVVSRISSTNDSKNIPKAKKLVKQSYAAEARNEEAKWKERNEETTNIRDHVNRMFS